MTAGFILALGGLVIFCIGASQVYYYKLTRKKVVTYGIYNLIRHPQYAALAISGFGLLILWPRYIATSKLLGLNLQPGTESSHGGIWMDRNNSLHSYHLSLYSLPKHLACPSQMS